MTGECGCIAGYSESCKHVFALLHYVEHHVSLGHNKTCTSKKQTWHETIKKGEKVHPPVRMSEVSFNRPHPEYVEGYVKPKRTLFDPRPVQFNILLFFNGTFLFAGDFLFTARLDSSSYPFKYNVGTGLTSVGLPYSK